MSEIVTILLLALLQFATGFSVLNLTGFRMKGFMAIAVSVLLGVALNSISVFALILCKIPLTSAAVFTSLFITLILFAGLGFKTIISYFKHTFEGKWFLPKLYEIPAIGLLCFMMFVSAWRCYYTPPTPRDLTSGPEVIAEYAVKEKTIANSVFSVNLESTNNQFKSPYVTTLQIIYKYAGFPFGQVWLSVLFAFFIMFLYKALSAKIHAVFAGILCVIFVCIPEMYAYTIMALFDYSNAIYFALGLYFLYEFASEKKGAVLSGLFFAIATYVRSETLVLVAFAGLVYFIQMLIAKNKLSKSFLSAVFVGVPALLMYYLSGPLFLNNYLPQKYDVGGLVNKNLGNLKPFSDRLSGIFDLLFPGDKFQNLYGGMVIVFVVIVVADVLFAIITKVKYDDTVKRALNWIGGAVLVIVGLAFLGYLLPLMDLANSTKRGLFKLFPVLLLYTMHSLTLQFVTRKLKF